MPARMNITFKDHFLLSDDHIMKIHEMISTKLHEFGYSEKILYNISRADSFIYNTEEISDIIKEENSKINKITKVKIRVHGHGLWIDLEFATRGAELLVESENRDHAYILFSDLKSYIETEILTIKNIDFISHVIFPSSLLVLFIALILFFSDGKDPVDISHILNGTIDEKLNYLISKSIPSKLNWHSFSVIISFIGIFLLSPVFFTSDFFEKYLYQKNIFYWGKEKNRYDKYTNLRSKFLWGLLICPIVGILWGHALSFFSR